MKPRGRATVTLRTRRKTKKEKVIQVRNARQKNV